MFILTILLILSKLVTGTAQSMRIKNLSLIIPMILCALVASTAQTVPTPTAAFVVPEEKSKPVIIPKFDKPPTIDGKLDDEVWQKAQC